LLDGGEVYGNTLPAEDAMSLALLFVITDETANGGQGIVFKQYASCFVELVFF
jgi:hypothetical protein